MMVSANSVSPFLVLLILASFVTSMFCLAIIPDKTQDGFLECLSHSWPNCYSFIFTPQNSSYSPFIQLYTFNHRFNLNTTAVILTPNQVSQIQSTVTCATEHGMHIKIRGGGHDYEALSFRSLVDLPYAILDLSNLRKVSVDVQEKVAWVEAGATLGELYYGISSKTKTLGFPAGTCSTVGVGGHFSGGGEGMMMRKHGLAADHIIDAHLVDVEGRVLDRASMGEDLFWAIRGGGGNTFGVIVSWKVTLVPVPPVVTVFNVVRNLEQNATDIVHQWQKAVPKFEEDLVMRIFITREKNVTPNSSSQGVTRIQTAFTALFLGGAERFVSSMENTFSGLGLVREDCIEMSWIGSILYYAGYQKDEPLNVLLNRDYRRTRLFPGNVNVSAKAKSDYVTKPIPNNGLEGIWERVGGNTEFPQSSQLQLTSYGGRMDKISESSIPFPHRAGIIYQIHYAVVWSDQDCGVEVSRKHMDWIGELYNYMTPFVSKNPRAVYANYRDLDLGNSTSYEQAQEWGLKYFKGNFQRLVNIKTAVDPVNFFRNEQSIPPHCSSSSLLTDDS